MNSMTLYKMTVQISRNLVVLRMSGIATCFISSADKLHPSMAWWLQPSYGFGCLGHLPCWTNWDRRVCGISIRQMHWLVATVACPFIFWLLFLSWLGWFVANAMMTSSNGNIFRVTGYLCGEFTGPRWFPRTMASDAKLSCFLWIDGCVTNREAGDLRRHRAHNDVIVMAGYCYSHCGNVKWPIWHLELPDNRVFVQYFVYTD